MQGTSVPIRCTGTRKDGTPCQADRGLVDGVCPTHRGLVDHSAAAARRHALERERQEAVQAQVQRSKLAPRDRLALTLVDRWDEIQAVLLDGAIADRDRATLIRLMSEAFGRPTETTVTVEKQEELPLEALVDLWRQLKEEKAAGTVVAQGEAEAQCP